MSTVEKISTIEQTVDRVRRAQQAGEVVAMCHGCFDIVHPGHIRHLQEAARLGDRLLVTITGDLKLNKGDGRPLIPQELRAENLAALDCVDWVAINDEATAAGLLELIRPDMYIKGREYEQNRDPRFEAEKAAVERHGGRVVFSSGDVVFSSTALIGAMEDTADPQHAQLRQLMSPDVVAALLAGFQGRRVLVIGETIRETYLMCDRPTVAGNDSTMTLRPIERQSFDAGAIIVTRHLAALGVRPTLITALPRTPAAESLRKRLAGEGILVRSVEVDHAFFEMQRLLTGTSKMVNLDLTGPMTIDTNSQRQMQTLAVDAAEACEAAIIVNHGHGLLSAALTQELCESLRPRVELLAGGVAGQRARPTAMQRADLLALSESELRDAMHNYDEGLSAVVWKALEQADSRACLVGGADGSLTAFGRKPDAHHEEDESAWRSRLDAEFVPAFSAQPIDSIGAHEARLTVATLGLLVTKSLPRASVLGNIAAAVAARHMGWPVVTPADLRRDVQRLSEARLTSEQKSAMPAIRAAT